LIDKISKIFIGETMRCSKGMSVEEFQERALPREILLLTTAAGNLYMKN
jgi:hypothetical protein